MSAKICYLMRGLPSCGKSHTARTLAGTEGVICETDEYFFTQVGIDPTSFDYRDELMPQARQWNFERFAQAIDHGRSPVIVDRGNGRNLETLQFARYAVDHGYQVKLREPDSPWWQEIRALLKRKKASRRALDKWADELSQLSRKTHRVPASTIREWMEGWRHDLTVADILKLKPGFPKKHSKKCGRSGSAPPSGTVVVDFEAAYDTDDGLQPINDSFRETAAPKKKVSPAAQDGRPDDLSRLQGNSETRGAEDPDIAKFLNED